MPYEKSTPASPEAHSGSPVQDNLVALAALFPSVVRDGQVDVDALRQLCGEAVVKEDELFGLNWHGKAEARAAALTPSLGTLRPCKEESKDWDTTQNIYIEGDNLEVLKLLRKSYSGRVKMIYIDPPYNTGKEFVYPDNYHDSIANYKQLTGQNGKFAANTETSGRFHTDWLNMMYPRLVIARELLSDDGVIFISIDHSEINNLMIVCNEVFGTSQKLGLISTINNLKGRSDDAFFATCNEFLCVYAKNKELLTLNGFQLDEEEIESEYDLEDEISPYKLIGFRKTGKGWERHHRPFMFYPVLLKDGDFSSVTDEEYHRIYNPQRKTFDDAYVESLVSKYRSKGYTVFLPTTETGELGRWRWGRDTFMSQKDINLDVNNANTLCTKMRATLEDGSIRLKTAKTCWYKPEYDSGSSAKLVKKLFNCKSDIFENPKSIYYLMDIIHVASKEDSIILDFFSGSATTAHAVMQLNAEDGSNRRFIMVQLPEPCDEKSEAVKAGYQNICEIGKERIRRAGEKVKAEAGLESQKLDIGFRVYKLDSSNVKAWNPQPTDLVDAMESYGEHLVAGRTEDDFLTEILLKSGIDLTEEIETRDIAGHTVHSLGYGQYYACMDVNLADDQEEVALGIAAWHDEEIKAAGGEQQDTCTVFVLDKAFGNPTPDDAAKLNFVELLNQHNIHNVKAL